MLALALAAQVVATMRRITPYPASYCVEVPEACVSPTFERALGDTLDWVDGWLFGVLGVALLGAAARGDIGEWFQIPCTITQGKDGEFGAVRSVANEILVGKTELSYTYTQPVRAIGARWSLSTVVKPDNVAINPANLNVMLRVKQDWLTPAYRARRPGFVPVFVQGGTNVSRINRQLGEIGLALQTSGASDGHRIAGCIATGTHGSAWTIG